MPRPTTSAAILVVTLLAAARAGPACGETIKDPATAIAFWSPDGWAALAESKAAYSVHRRVAPDGKALCGCLAGKVAGGVEDLLEALEAYWREGPETFTRVTKTDATVNGSLGLRVEYRINAGAKTLRAYAVLGVQGDLRAAIWAASDEAADAGFATLREKILGSLAFPGRAAPAPAEQEGGAPGAGSGLMYDPKFREGKPFDALAKGDEPLLRAHVDAFVDLFEAAYGVALTSDEDRALRDAIEASYPAWETDAKARLRHRLIERGVVLTSLSKGDATAAKASLAAFSSEVDSRIESAPTAAFHQPLRHAKTRRASVFSPGEPPVPVSAEDAFEELVHFLVCVARNEDRPLTAGQRTAVRAETQKVLDATGPAMRRHYARMHRLWLLVKARWDGGDVAGKMRMRWAAIRAFRGVAPAGSAAAAGKTNDGDLAAYANAAAEVAQSLAAFDAYTVAFQNPQAILTAALAGSGQDPGDLEKAFATETLPLR